jgi:two-component system, OmpR family, sensor kinase
MRRPFASLTSRLVITTVALVLVVSVLTGLAATLAIHKRLTDQVDAQLDDAVRQAPFLLNHPPDGPDGGPQFNTRPGTIVAAFFDDPSITDLAYKTNVGREQPETLSADVRSQLQSVQPDGETHSIDLSGLGGYRVRAIQATDGVLVVGLPTQDVSDAVESLIGYEAVLIALGALVAAGGGVLLVRRQLRPLREVAATADRVSALPLAEGEIDLAERVPERLTDERTEVGQVGAALNTLLDHVETSLDARQRSEQQVRQFVADASHELRTPLATIAGYTELARRRPDEHIVRSALGKVEEESGRMTSLVEDMLLLARLDAGRGLQREPVDLSRLLVEAVDDARVLGPDHRWRLELPEPSADGVPQPVEVVGDEQRLHQVVTNLLTNARKHTPAGTTVTVTVRPDGFDVHDDGPGFPPEFVGHAFERFARVDQARERSGGAGLGLSLVEAIVRSHGGTVAIKSASTGTTIEVRLR